MAEYTFKRFNQDEDVVAGKQKIKTFPIWSDSPSDADTNSESTLTDFWTQSAEVLEWEGNYYYNIFGEDTASNANAPVQFSVAFATTQSVLLQNSDSELQYTYPSRAIYGQFLNILEEKSVVDVDGYFQRAITGSTSTFNMDIIYVISAARARIKDRIELDTWQLNLSGSDGGFLNLINETGSEAGAKVVNIISGRLTDYTGEVASASEGDTYGLFYPERGVFVLDAVKIFDQIGSASPAYDPSIMTTTASYAPAAPLSEIWKLIDDGEYFRARTTENVQSTHYFCRVKNFEFNYSTNPTWVSGSNNEILDDFYAEPKTFITTVCLYDGDSDSGQLVAVAKISRPIPKDTETEALIKVKLDF